MKTTLPANRQAVLAAQRAAKMAQSAHAYVRGSTTKFYEWLEAANATLPDGPPIWICGDCHVGNLGPVADARGRIETQIRDLDQTVIGNPAHDLVRLGLSLASAARSSDLPGVTTVRMLEQITEGYQEALSGKVSSEDDEHRPRAARIVMKRAVNRTWKHLAVERLGGKAATIELGKRFWPLTKKEREEITCLFQEEAVRKLATSLRARDDDAKVRMLDAAYWMKGCSSLGRLRVAVLLQVGDNDDPSSLCLMDLKEAIKAAAPRNAAVTMPRDNGERVVEGARHLAPYLGERMLAARVLGRAIFMRELLPQDLKLELETLTREDAAKAARFLACVVGRAHARQLTEAQRTDWSRELERNRSKSLNAPGWLWNSIVELMSIHEAAYLEHCRTTAAAA